ncbi:hypothetical protein STANM309S_02063 [Streptomyces tanashiensis]
MPMSLPRTRDSRASFRPTRSRPPSRTRPDIRAVGGSSPMTPIAVADLPEPDSPTMPSVRPGSTSKLIPRTAATGPASEGKEILRSRTDRTGLCPVPRDGASGDGRRVDVIARLPGPPRSRWGRGRPAARRRRASSTP